MRLCFKIKGTVNTSQILAVMSPPVTKSLSYTAKTLICVCKKKRETNMRRRVPQDRDSTLQQPLKSVELSRPFNRDPRRQCVCCLVCSAATHSVIFNSSSPYINSHLKAVCSVPCDHDAQSLFLPRSNVTSLFLFISEQHPDSRFPMLTNTVRGVGEGFSFF